MKRTGRRVRTRRDAKGASDLKIIERTSASVLQSRLPPRSGRHLKHCHSLKASRQIVRIDRREWEERVAEMLRICERHRWEKANSLHNALDRVALLLRAAQERQRELEATTGRLEQTTSYLQTLMDSMADILIATDPGGRITEANRAAGRLAGYTREELVGRPFAGLFAEAELAAGGIETVLARRQLTDYELTLVLKDGGTIPVLLNATALVDAQDRATGALVNARDMTELKRAQETLEQYATELARANEDLEEFASVASHDLQEPLKRVTRYASGLAERFGAQLGAEARQEIAFMVEQAENMQNLIRNVLAYARAGVEDKAAEPIDGNQVLERALQNLRGAIEESRVRVTWDPLPVVDADVDQLVRVFQNLIGNAIKYRDPESAEPAVHVSAERVETTERSPPEGAPGSGWLFSVTDDGIGVDPDFQDEIFDMFVRLHTAEEFPGAGMGLAIVRKIVGRHGGVIWVESRPDEGSTFCFILPEGPR